MRYTLLELCQRILESCDSDEVNSITDTAEAQTVANIIKEVYFDLIGEIEPKDSEGLFHLDASTDDLLPTVMYLPDNVVDIHWLRYNVGDTLQDTNFRPLTYLDVDDFFEYSDGLDLNENWVTTQEIDGFVFKLRNDQYPSYYTSTDGKTLLFDSYDASVEDTLTSSRTYGYGQLVQTFDLVDTFVPKLNPRQFQLLLQTAKAQAFIELKQTENATAERKARRNKILAYKTKDSSVDPRSDLWKHGGYGRCTPGRRVLGRHR